MSEVEKQELIDRLFNDHEVRMRLMETAVKEMIAERKDLRKTIAKMQAGLTRIQTGLAIFGALWLWIEVRPFFEGRSPAHQSPERVRPLRSTAP